MVWSRFALLAVAAFAAHAEAQEDAPPAYRGIPLPLKAGEQVVKFADGNCAAIVASQEGAKFVRARRWVGGCRFGLASGLGIAIDGDAFITRVGHYGLLTANPADSVLALDARPGAKDGYFLLRSASKPVDVPSFAPDFVYLIRGPTAEGSELGQSQAFKIAATTLSCPLLDGNKRKPASLTFMGITAETPGSDAPLILKACPVGPITGGLLGAFNATPGADGKVRVVWAWHKIAGKTSLAVRACSLPDCVATWRQMIAPDRSTILEAEADNARWTQEYVADLTVRFKPLEDAWQAQVRAMRGNTANGGQQ